VDIAPILDNVADIDPHAEFDAAIWRDIGVSLADLTLHFHGATHRIDDTGKLKEQAIASGFDYAAAVLLNFGIGHLPPKRLQPPERSFLVGTHQSAVARHIGSENGGQPAFDAFRGQSGTPQPHGPNGLSAFETHSSGKREGWHFLSVRPPV
jgi:hypothetical protein